MDTKKVDTDAKTAPEAPAMPAPGEPGPGPSAVPSVPLHLGGSSGMVKNDRKGRKMTGFKRQEIIIILMDISEPSRTSMAKQIF